MEVDALGRLENKIVALKKTLYHVGSICRESVDDNLVAWFNTLISASVQKEQAEMFESVGHTLLFRLSG